MYESEGLYMKVQYEHKFENSVLKFNLNFVSSS